MGGDGEVEDEGIYRERRWVWRGRAVAIVLELKDLINYCFASRLRLGM